LSVRGDEGVVVGGDGLLKIGAGVDDAGEHGDVTPFETVVICRFFSDKSAA
jgi:hypothetical protein